AFALLFALGTAVSIGKKDAGSDRMKEIAGYISEGAKAFIGKEYSIIS
ncbi:MAG: sodium/proton-translocating pyrophosphatase, partial [Oscillospiraceae bacterium]|nr:sodium/proton-translocating pyrophosphatase [Oscillospiraceae bacterium]